MDEIANAPAAPSGAIIFAGHVFVPLVDVEDHFKPVGHSIDPRFFAVSYGFGGEQDFDEIRRGKVIERDFTLVESFDGECIEFRQEGHLEGPHAVGTQQPCGMSCQIGAAGGNVARDERDESVAAG